MRNYRVSQNLEENCLPLVSVIMGVYNVPDEKMAEEAIQSILLQTYRNIELIICEDGSTNNTMEMLERIASRDTRIRLIKNKTNRGLAYSLNHCLRYANGKYIARMDIDDVSYLDRIEKQVQFIENNDNYSIVGTWAELFSGSPSNVWGIRKKEEIPGKKSFLFGPPAIHPTILAKKSSIDQIGGYKVQWDTVRAEDYELFMRLYAEGFKFYNIQEVLYKFREDRNSYRRRSYKHRFEEAHVRMIGFRRLKLYPLALPYVIKPLIVGLIPQSILKALRREEM